MFSRNNLLKRDLDQRNFHWLLMTLPGFFWILVFKYLTLAGLGIAFIDFKPRRGILGSKFTGVENFEFLFKTDIVIRAIRNTLYLNTLFILVGTVFALFVAFLIYQIYSSKSVKFYQTVLLLPTFISMSIATYFVFALLATENGMFNMILKKMGQEPVSWYSTPKYWPFILLVIKNWQGVGWSSLIYLAAMLAVNPQLYEAANLDGAGKFRQFRSITLPLILPIVVLNMLLAIGHIFSADFSLFYLIPRNRTQLYPVTDVLDTFIYRTLTGSSNISMASAAQFIQSVTGFVLILFSNWLVKTSSAKDRDLSIF